MAALAARQHGVVSVAQLRELGFDGAAITRRVQVGRLHRLHRGVYAVGHKQLTPEGRWLAAVLACGRKAVLSHASAAGLWRIRQPNAGATIHVTVPTHAGIKQRKGIRVHRSPSVEATEHEGIPVTTPAQTLRDIKPALSDYAWKKALEQAEILRLDTGEQAREGEATRSELEETFLSLVEDHGLPQPLVNRKVEGLRVDFLWPEHHLIVESDGWETHGTRTAFERDRQRDAKLTKAGYRVLRFSWRQITQRPHEVAAALTAAGLPGCARSARSRRAARR